MFSHYALYIVIHILKWFIKYIEKYMYIPFCFFNQLFQW